MGGGGGGGGAKRGMETTLEAHKSVCMCVYAHGCVCIHVSMYVYMLCVSVCVYVGWLLRHNSTFTLTIMRSHSWAIVICSSISMGANDLLPYWGVGCVGCGGGVCGGGVCGGGEKSRCQ